MENDPKYHRSHVNTASTIIESYKGEIPLSVFLKKFFSANKKYGSRDRKQISSLCFDHFRKVAAAKLSALKDELSSSIDPEKFQASFLQQPDLFIRIRPGFEKIVIDKLKSARLPAPASPLTTCISLPNSTKLDKVLQLNKEAVIQDANSQKVLDHLTGIGHDQRLSLWDCCAASGGKTILAYDILGGNADITVSDIRESILSNLKKRFAEAGIKNYHSLVADLTSIPHFPLPTPDLLICDAPCTGSGTWARTPEQLDFFDPEKIDEYAEKQKKIVSTALPQLKKGGLFFYITCSVFKKENEDVSDFIKEKFDVHLLEMKTLPGYEIKADTMFTCTFRKN